VIVERWVLAVITSARLLASQGEFYPANVTNLGGVYELRLFPPDKAATVIKIPVGWPVKFAGDGRSLYAGVTSSLVRIDFNPVRSAPVAGTQGFGPINDFAVTPDQRKIVISGPHREDGGEKCGLFEITVSTGVAKRVLAADCNYQWSWTDLTISPRGDRAVASYGNTHMDLIDLAHGTTKSLDERSVDGYTMLISSILYFQRKITGSALTSAK